MEFANRMVNWWRYFLIFMGVSFNKVRAVHELTPDDEAFAEELRTSLRRLAEDPLVRSLFRGRAEGGHVNAEIWRKLPPADPSLAAFRFAGFDEAVRRYLPAEVSNAWLSAPAGGKVAFVNKPALWSHGDKNVHRFPLAGEEYLEKILHVPFDPDSEIRALELGVPVKDGSASWAPSWPRCRTRPSARAAALKTRVLASARVLTSGG